MSTLLNTSDISLAHILYHGTSYRQNGFHVISVSDLANSQMQEKKMLSVEERNLPNCVSKMCIQNVTPASIL